MRSHEQRDLTARLNALAESPAPPAALDATAAIARGRVRLRRRRQALIGVVAGSTAAVLAGVLLLRPADGAPVPALPTPTAPTLAAPSPTATPKPTASTGPLSAEARFGWLPSWLAQPAVGYAKSDGLSVATASTRTAVQGAYPSLRLSLLTGTAEYVAPGLHKVTAPAVDGREAHWLNSDEPSGSPAVLRWMTASGRWAELTASLWSGSKVQSDLLRVAAGAEFAGRDVPFPVRPTAVPADLTLRNVELHRPSRDSEPPWSTIVSYTVDGKWLSVTAQPADFGVFADGRPDGGTPVCRVEKGVRLCANGTAAGIPSVQRIGGLAGLLARFEVLGADEASWTAAGDH
ncbi:hypothetical protein [Streptomyces sp. CBMA156]|uniref:hypothetical protein n=1 Tax=Streptomyces sp. CBMA156 TaxID=1930280 RepID=UPI001661D9D2|nr:hypothetical protein [Streptomyces sp. CBMA156]MBD0673700.1 hypothetical protein [Streptomyces sp. CBMA156]